MVSSQSSANANGVSDQNANGVSGDSIDRIDRINGASVGELIVKIALIACGSHVQLCKCAP